MRSHLSQIPVGERNAVVVYGASSRHVAHVYTEAAHALGRQLALKGLEVVNGGGRAGLMAATTEGALSVGGKVTGVLPQFMIDRGWAHDGLSRTIPVATMHERKAMMAAMTRGAIALPGGIGTLEELLEILTWRQLGLYSGHAVILNVNGYYDPLVEMLDRSVDQQFMNPDHARLWNIVADPAEAVRIVASPVEERSFSQKL